MLGERSTLSHAPSDVVIFSLDQLFSRIPHKSDKSDSFSQLISSAAVFQLLRGGVSVEVCLVAGDVKICLLVWRDFYILKTPSPSYLVINLWVCYFVSL